jgi:hypothetical protein
MGPNRSRPEAGNCSFGTRDCPRQGNSHSGLQWAGSGSADSLARRQAYRHRRIQSNRDPRDRALARPLDTLCHGRLGGGRWVDDRTWCAVPLSLRAAASGIPLVSHPRFCRARPEARNLYRTVRLLLYRTQRRRRCVRPGNLPDAARLERVHGSQRRLVDGSCVRIWNRRRPYARLWQSCQSARGPTSAFASSECQRKPDSLAGAGRATNSP